VISTAPALRFATVLIVILLARSVQAQTITVTVPVGLSFSVVDVAAATGGSPNPTQVTYSTALGFANNERLKISVQAAASTFAGPGTTRIPASKVSWTATASAGTPSNGTLSSGAYTQVYISPNRLRPTSTGSVNQTWTLAAVAASGLRSGTHTLTVRWKFEVF
jgi:hypothetical protein